MRLHQGFAQCGDHPGERHRLAGSGPRCVIHADEELFPAERCAGQEHFEVFLAPKVLDRNTQVRLHKTVIAKPDTKINRARARARPVAQY